MSTGNPQFSPKPASPDVVEKIKSAQEVRWEQKRAEVEKRTDALGMEIDEGIKDAVIAFNVNGIPTSQSCEGHFENGSDHGYPVPWITVEAINKPKWRYESEEEIYQQIAEKYGVTVDQVLHAENEEAWVEVEALRLGAEQEETLEYKTWDKENDILFTKVETLLNEFYTDRNVPDEVRIIIDRGAGWFDVHNGGKFYIPNSEKERLQTELTEEERARIPEVLKSCQKEMQDFTAFLKNKFLAHKEETQNEGESDEQIFQEYMEKLQLKQEDLYKKILDVGSGSAQFAKWVKEHHAGSKVFSLEPNQELEEKTKSVKAGAEAIPFKDEAFELVISNGAIPNVLQRSYGEDIEVVRKRVRNSLFEMMRVVKPGGEVRLGRVGREVDPQDPHFVSNEILDTTFNELRKTYGVEIEEIHTPPDSYKYDEPLGKPVKLTAKVYLIKIRKPLNPNTESRL